MRIIPAISIVFILSMIAHAAFAREPILLFNNYTPPIPALEVLSVTPADHSQMSAAPSQVKVSFNEALDEGASSITVYDPYSNVIANSGKMTQTTELDAALPAKMLDGTYRIEWKGTCACQGHAVISGTAYFTIY